MTGDHFDRIAEFYDVLHDDVDYAGEAALMEDVFSRTMDRRPATVLDLGCGTGNHARVLATLGHRVTGIDSSAGMVRVARRKARGVPHLEFVRADMRRFDLRRRFDAAVCMDGAFTHLLTERDLLSHLRAVRRHLAPDGVYVFEFAQPLKEETEGPGWIDHGSSPRIVWLYDITFDHRQRLLTAKNRFFAFDRDRVLARFVDTNSTRLVSVPLLRRLLSRTGMRLERVFSTDEGSALRPLRKDDPLPMAVARPTGP